MTAPINPPVQRVDTVDEAERWTHEDFMQLAPEDKKAELIQGAIIVNPPPFLEHDRLQTLLVSILKMYVSRFDLGVVLGSRTAVYLSGTETYEPDILFVSDERLHIITRSKLTEAPDLVVEILSASTAKYDRGIKRENYAEAGVRELWLIDPHGPEGTQFYQQRDDKLIEVAPIEGIIHSITLPNFKLNTDWLWPDEDGEMANPHEVLEELGAI